MRRDDFIPPLPTDETGFFRRATIVLDTNVLLAPYKLSATARHDALRAIQSSAERLWLPHQVGVEFYRNHASNRDLRSNAYTAALKQTSQFETLVTKHLGTGTTHEDLRKSVAGVVSDGVRQIRKGIEDIRTADTAITSPEADEVLELIEAAFEGRAAPAPAPTTVRARTEEFINWRVPARVPPGYEDKGKPGTARSAGDYLIWAEILEHASANNLDILFVTEDGKDDWWEEIDGVRRPHRALVLEFQRVMGPGRRYHQVSMDTFVRLATKDAGDEAEQSTIDEIVAVNDETRAIESRELAAAWLDAIYQSKHFQDARSAWSLTPNERKNLLRNVRVHWPTVQWDPFGPSDQILIYDPQSVQSGDDLDGDGDEIDKNDSSDGSNDPSE